jgi:hypothetical protein
MAKATVKPEKAISLLTGRRSPRGKTGRTTPLTSTLKELSPLVYAFLVVQLKKPERKRQRMLQPIIKEWRQASGSQRRPSAREFTAFVIERAMGGAWQVWGVKPPFSQGEADSFLRRYVHGHEGALRDFRKVVAEKKRAPHGDVRDWLPKFFGPPGDAAREFNLLTTEQEPFTLITLFEEETPG